MTFPKRWLDDDNAARSVRDVLRAGRHMDPPAGAENAVWLALAGQIGAAGAAGGAGAAAAGASSKAAGAGAAAAGSGTAAGGAAATAGSAIGGGILKSILIGAFGGVLAVTGYSAIEPARAPLSPVPAAATQPPPSSGNAPSETKVAAAAAPAVLLSASASAASSPPSGEPREASPGGTPPAASANAEPSGAASASPSEASAGTAAPLPGSLEERESRLREESEMLGRARAALRGGDTGGAMRLLEQARTKFPEGVLGQEREALTIETLAKSGAREAASVRAAAFIKAHPQSPHAARLQPYVQP
jgi:hypothetical protein